MSSILTGITTSGTPHLGNYIGAIKPSLIKIKKVKESFLFLADYHSLIKQQEPELTHSSSLEIASAWLACGLDPKKTFFYRQSRVPQIMELNWILSNTTSKGLLNRAHAYKAAVDLNQEKKIKDLDKGISAGTFNYPILMAADILIFDAEIVPVGSDQKQHIEMTRDIANKFNITYGESFILPEAIIDENIHHLPGLDGEKMSKSYSNFIDLFISEKDLQKKINQIKTDSLEPGQKKPKNSILYKYFECFSDATKIKMYGEYFNDGMGWGDLKKELYSLINIELSPYREKYNELISKPKIVEDFLREGESKAYEIANKNLNKIRQKIGIRPL